MTKGIGASFDGSEGRVEGAGLRVEDCVFAL